VTLKQGFLIDLAGHLAYLGFYISITGMDRVSLGVWISRKGPGRVDVVVTKDLRARASNHGQTNNIFEVELIDPTATEKLINFLIGWRNQQRGK
jgi:hypothetical protein